MKITDFLDVEMVISNLRGGDKGSVLREMAEWMASQDHSLEARGLLEILLERERVSSTAIGDGVAIPHGKMAGVQRVRAVFARSLQGVDFASLDGKPTFLFFLLIAPENSPGDHLKALARISRLLKDGGFRQRLMEAKTREKLFDTIKKEDDRL